MATVQDGSEPVGAVLNLLLVRVADIDLEVALTGTFGEIQAKPKVLATASDRELFRQAESLVSSVAGQACRRIGAVPAPGSNICDLNRAS